MGETGVDPRLGWLQLARTAVELNICGPFKTLRAFLRQCWVYNCRVSSLSFLLTASYCLPFFFISR